MLSRNLSHNQRPSIVEGQEIAETLCQDYIDRLVWKTGHSTGPESCQETTLSTPRDSSAVVAMMSNVVTQLKIIMPELKTVYYRQDNAGCDHCGFTMVCAIILGLQ